MGGASLNENRFHRQMAWAVFPAGRNVRRSFRIILMRYSTAKRAKSAKFFLCDLSILRGTFFYSFATRRSFFNEPFSDSYTRFTPSPSDDSVTRMYLTRRSKPPGSTDAA